MSVETARRLVERFAHEDARRPLLAFIERQRWFGGRGRGVASLEVVECVPVREEGRQLWVVLAELHHDDGAVDLYHVPLTRAPLAEAAVAQPDHPALVLVGDQDGERVAIYDAMADEASVATLFEAIAAGERHRGVAGELQFRALFETAGRNGAGADSGAVTVRPLGKEQSNSAAVRGDRELLKCLRRVWRGVNPELEMTATLAAAGFTQIPTPLGAAEYLPNGGGDAERILLLTVQPFLHNGTEGLALALTSLRDLYADAEESPDASAAERLAAVRQRGATFLPEATRIGECVGRMHRALSGEGLPAAMRPRPVERGQLDTWATEFTAELDRLLGGEIAGVEHLRARRDALAASFAALRDLPDGGTAIRVHGDLHLGQLLRTDGGWTILDFEGEPARSLEARRRHSSPLNDVAGLLRSLDYAAAIALTDRVAPADPEWGTLMRWGDSWSAANRQALWEAYLGVVAGTPLLPRGEGAEVLRRAFELRKAVYEVGYELGHRPDWVAIPMRFLLAATESRR